MNFLDIHGEEINLIAIAAVDAIEGPSLGPKRRSGVATEDQGNRPIREPQREPNFFAITLPLTG